MEIQFSAQAFTKMVLHSMKYPHSTCSGLLLSPQEESRIHDAMPVSHASNFLTPNIEIAFNAVTNLAQENDLVISGYYQTCPIDPFSQKIAEKICETNSNAVLCIVVCEEEWKLEAYQLSDGKWKRRQSKLEEEVVDRIIYSKEKLYRQIVDFDEHFNDISLDWSNAKISQRIDYYMVNDM